MRQLLIIPMEELERLLDRYYQALRGQGIDMEGLVSYSLHAATASDYQTLESYLVHDLLSERPDLHVSAVHTCIEFVGEAGCLLAEYIRRMAGRFDHTARLEGFLGRDAVISIQLPH